jgi:hypothetical protein
LCKAIVRDTFYGHLIFLFEIAMRDRGAEYQFHKSGRILSRRNRGSSDHARRQNLDLSNSFSFDGLLLDTQGRTLLRPVDLAPRLFDLRY